MQISISTGLKEIEIVRDGKVAGSIFFSPADPSLLSRLKEVTTKAEEIEKRATIDRDNLEDALESAAAIDKEIRGLIDWAFGNPVSDVVFGDSYSFTTSAGVSALEQFLNGATAFIESEMKKEVAAAEKHQKKYLDKYRK